MFLVKIQGAELLLVTYDMSREGAYLVETKREESGLHDQDKYPALQLCLRSDKLTYEMYATPSSTSRLGSNGASFATV